MTGEDEYELDKLRSELAKERHLKWVLVMFTSTDQQISVLSRNSCVAGYKLKGG